MTYSMQEINSRLTHAERAIAKCQDAHLQRVLRATVRYWQEQKAKAACLAADQHIDMVMSNPANFKGD